MEPIMADPRVNRSVVLGSMGAVAALPLLGRAADWNAARPGAPERVFDATLHIGASQGGAGNQRWAELLGGEVTGPLLSGRVESGRIDWCVDPMSGATDLTIACMVRDHRGRRFRLQDRTTHAAVDQLAMQPGIPTAPALFDAGGSPRLAQGSLLGRLDARAFPQGRVRLSAFRAI
jgi:hypothetical protein